MPRVEVAAPAAEAPRRPARQHADEHEPDAAPAACDGAVVRDRPRPLSALAEAHQQRERGGRGDGGSDALHGPRGEQPVDRLCDTAEQRRRSEQPDAGDEHAAASEVVPRAGAEQQQAAERQGVRVLHPGEARRREAERAVDVGQRRDDHRDVQDQHQYEARMIASTTFELAARRPGDVEVAGGRSRTLEDMEPSLSRERTR
jgi:hypothetical protein